MRAGKLTAVEAERTYQRAKTSNKPQGAVLVETGMLTKNEISDAVRRQKELKLAALFASPWNGGDYELRPEAVASRYDLPIERPIPSFLLDVVSHDIAASVAQAALESKKRLETAVAWDADHARRWGFELNDKDQWILQTVAGRTLQDAAADLGGEFNRAVVLVFVFAATGVLGAAGRPDAATAREETRPATAAAHAPEHPKRNRQGGVKEARELIQREGYQAAVNLLDTLPGGQDAPEVLTLSAWARFKMVGTQDGAALHEMKTRLNRAIVLDTRNDEAHLYLGLIEKASGRPHRRLPAPRGRDAQPRQRGSETRVDAGRNPHPFQARSGLPFLVPRRFGDVFGGLSPVPSTPHPHIVTRSFVTPKVRFPNDFVNLFMDLRFLPKTTIYCGLSSPGWLDVVIPRGVVSADQVPSEARFFWGRRQCAEYNKA
ncbi:MAG: hypothetical protein M5R36_06040 [Deltaproteobacteria bacterium]|nr:hypothetical protein [Deltaproteobacteria bacterium]